LVLFTAHPTALAVSPPKSITGRGYSVRVKAVVAGPMDPAPQPITLFVIIERGKLADRRRALPQDGCARETYEKVEVPKSRSGQSMFVGGCIVTHTEEALDYF
jgi:hypothetical protein